MRPRRSPTSESCCRPGARRCSPSTSKSEMTPRTSMPNPSIRIWPGSPYPLGATWDGEGVNFALFSENATAVELCLFERPDDARETHRIRIEECTDFVWHIYLPESRPGQLYGYRVHGLYEPEAGLRFNP